MLKIYSEPKGLVEKIFPWVIVMGVVYYFTSTLVKNWEAIEQASLGFSWLNVMAVFFFTSAVVTSGLLWGRILGQLSNKVISRSDSIRIHCASWLLKYVPGQVGSLLNKLSWGKNQGIKKKTVTTSFLYENILMIFASMVLSTPVIILFREQIGDDLVILLPLLAIIPMLIILYKPIFYKLLNFVFAKIKKQPFAHSDFLSTRALFGHLAGYLFPRLLNGIGFVLVAVALLGAPPETYIGLIATYTLAGAVGLLAIFVPSGLGVREGVIVLLASAYFPIEQAILLSLVARFYATIADIGVAGVYLALNNGKVKQV